MFTASKGALVINKTLNYQFNHSENNKMEKMIQILTSPIWWSTCIAFFGVILGFKLYIAKVISEDKAIEEKRRQHQSLEDKNVE
ncbi:MAG: hypothetical protein V5789_10735 [Colwellia sp.]